MEPNANQLPPPPLPPKPLPWWDKNSVRVIIVVLLLIISIAALTIIGKSQLESALRLVKNTNPIQKTTSIIQSEYGLSPTPAIQTTTVPFSGPVGLAKVDKTVWVANNQTNAITLFSDDGTFLDKEIIGNGLNYPIDIYVVGNTVWVTNKNTSSISVFNFSGSPIAQPLVGNSLSNPSYMKEINGHIWVANSIPNNFTITTHVIGSVFAPDGSPVDNLMDNGEFSTKPYFPGASGIEQVDKNVWVLDANDNSISIFDTSGNDTGRRITGNGMNIPLQLLIVGDNVWVLSTGDDTISVFTKNGAPVTQLHTGLGDGAGSMMLDGTNLWVTSNKQLIDIFNIQNLIVLSSHANAFLVPEKTIR